MQRETEGSDCRYQCKHKSGRIAIVSLVASIRYFIRVSIIDAAYGVSLVHKSFNTIDEIESGA